MTIKNAPKMLKKVIPCVVALGCTALAVLTPFDGSKKASAETGFGVSVGEYPYPAENYATFFSFFDHRLVNGVNTDYGGSVDAYKDFLWKMPYNGRDGLDGGQLYKAWEYSNVYYGESTIYYSSDYRNLVLQDVFEHLDNSTLQGGYLISTLQLKTPMYVNENLFGFFGRVSNSPVRVRVRAGNGGLVSQYPNATATLRGNIAVGFVDNEGIYSTKLISFPEVALPTNGGYYNVSGWLPSWSKIEQYAISGYVFLEGFYLEVAVRGVNNSSTDVVSVNYFHSTDYSAIPSISLEEVNAVQKNGAFEYGITNVKYVDSIGLETLWGGVFAFLETEIFPNFKLAYMLYIAIAFAIVMFFIKYALGG